MGLRVFLIPFCFDCPYFCFFSQLQKEKSTIAVKGSPWKRCRHYVVRTRACCFAFTAWADGGTELIRVVTFWVQGRDLHGFTRSSSGSLMSLLFGGLLIQDERARVVKGALGAWGVYNTLGVE